MNNKIINCKECGKQISRDAKICPGCGAKNKRPIYKKFWFWLIVIVIFIVIGAAGNSKNGNNSNGNSNDSNSGNKYSSSKNVVTMIDMSTMTEADINKWADEKKINIERKNEYSDTVKKGGFIRQSVGANQNIYEGDRITLVYSLGKQPTTSQKNALKKAESYSRTSHMSKQGIYNQLTSSFESFTKEEAQYAIDNIDADFNKNALEKAKSYQKTSNMSKQGIYNQLTSSIEGFTKAEAQYAIDHLED